MTTLSWINNEVFGTEKTSQDNSSSIRTLPNLRTLNCGPMVAPSPLIPSHQLTNSNSYHTIKTVAIVTGILFAIVAVKTCFLFYLPVLPKVFHLFTQMDIEKLIHHHILHPFQHNQDAICEMAMH